LPKLAKAGKGSGVFIFPYLRVNISPLTDAVPAVQMRLSWKGRMKTAWMLVDTGSTATVISPGIAEDLGLETKKYPHPVRGVGGDVYVRSSRAYVQLVEADTSGHQISPLLLDPLLVVPEEVNLPIPLLGRRPFLEQFEFTLRENRREFVLRRVREG
jgi:hypothetical protein